MLNKLKNLFEQLSNPDRASGQKSDPNLAMAALLCQVSQADHQIDPQEVQAKQQLLMKMLSVDDTHAKSLLEQASVRSEQSASLYEFTDQLRDLEHQQRYELIQSLWQVAYADGECDPIEEAIIRKTAELLYVNHSDFIRAKLSVISPE